MTTQEMCRAVELAFSYCLVLQGQIVCTYRKPCPFDRGAMKVADHIMGIIALRCGRGGARTYAEALDQFNVADLQDASEEALHHCCRLIERVGNLYRPYSRAAAELKGKRTVALVLCAFLKEAQS